MNKTENFIDRANVVHNFKYDYNNTIYINSLTKLEFKCPIHNIPVYMTPGNHLAGKGCRKCAHEITASKNSKPKEKFIEEAKLIHNNFYDYSLVDYKNAKIKVEIICPKHKNFWQTPDSHLSGKGCSKCRNEKVGKLNSLTQQEFIEKANKIHNFKYDYSKAIYINENCLMTIICPLHGEFQQNGANHLKSRGCQTCGNIGTSTYQKENPNGWSVDTWKKKAETSKFFDSFKVYIIECWNDTERFFKVGRTYTKVKYRFRYRTQLPYKYEILQEIVGTVEEIVKLELELKRLNKNSKYIPKLEFGGQHECYSKVNTKDAEYI